LVNTITPSLLWFLLPHISRNVVKPPGSLGYLPPREKEMQQLTIHETTQLDQFN